MSLLQEMEKYGLADCDFNNNLLKISANELKTNEGCKINYYALTHNSIWNLGARLSVKDADNYAVNQFNIHQAPSGYLILNKNELKELIRQSLRRLKGGNHE